jgi:hypothetical protein
VSAAVEKAGGAFTSIALANVAASPEPIYSYSYKRRFCRSK